MISGLSKAITLYLAPLLALTAILLSLFAYLAPTFLLHDKVALVTVVPSTALIPNSDSSQNLDGPSIFMGVLGSCSKRSNSASINCTAPSVSPQYDFSVLPGDAPENLLSAPTATSPIFIAIAITFSILFFLSFTLISFRHKMNPKMAGILEKPMMQRLSAWVGVFGFLVGLTAFLVVRMWFGKAVDDFNASITSQGQQGPKLIATTGNGFTMVWVAYAFYAVPVITSLTKLNVTATKK